MLVGQAIAEPLTLVTRGEIVASYSGTAILNVSLAELWIAGKVLKHLRNEYAGRCLRPF